MGPLNVLKPDCRAKRYSQEDGIEYQGTFSNVAKTVTVKSILAMAIRG